MDERVSRTQIDPDSDQRMVSLRRALGITSFGINQMVLQPGQQMRVHDHESQEEAYLVLEGTLTITIEGDLLELAAGQLARVPPGVRRQLSNRRRARVVLIALGGHGDHESRDAKAYASWDAQTHGTPQDVPLPDDLPPSQLND
ncbi:cupin domain-containing protein [Baekduia soli]|uniref:Cupin domain-containing protein n=1 Tax=Baekduia soli TaxID=496014 RepID=A0A5B8U4Z9_9ACTN|nr:cupin domain-containing protein [Baekduia soli]QEC48196.1 cupin domain-containing protein [Baekduia soli]